MTLHLATSAALIVALGMSSVAAADKASPPLMAADLGPSTVDVSNYPPGMQKIYPFFLQKCSGCHTAARAINAPYITAKEWSRYINRMMMRPPCCNYCPIISRKDAQTIWTFLVYDAGVRKTGAQAKFWAAQQEALKTQFQKYDPRNASSRRTP